MQEVRQKVYEEFLRRLDGLRREGVNGSWLWCLTRLWGVEKGKQVRWEELSWGEYYEKMVEMGEAEVNQEGEVVWSSGRARMLAELCGMKPTDLRWWGMVDHRWEGWMHKVGMTRRQARAVMGLVVWVGQAYSRELWKRRCEVEVEEGRCQRVERRQIIEEMRMEGMRVAGLLGWDRDRVEENFGQHRPVKLVRKAAALVRRQLKERERNLDLGGQRRVIVRTIYPPRVM